MLNLMSTVCWPPYKTGCYLNQERGTRNGCIAVIHIRIQVKNLFHKVLTNRPCYLLRRPSWKSACSKLVLRPFSSSRHPLFWILMEITGVNPFLVPRFPFHVSRSPFPILRFPYAVSRSPFPVLRSSLSALRSPLSALRSPFPAPRSSFPDPDFSTKPALSQVLFFQVSLIRGPHFKIYVFTCVRFWGCYMNKKFRLMPNVKRLRPPWTSAHLHNIIVTHAKHFSLKKKGNSWICFNDYEEKIIGRYEFVFPRKCLHEIKTLQHNTSIRWETRVTFR